MSGPTLVCFAVPQEAKPFRKSMPARSDLHVLVTGMGGRNAERALGEAMEKLSPALVFSCGFAGALAPSLRIGDVVFDLGTTPGEMASAFIELKAVPVIFHCATQVAITAAEKSALHASTGAGAVEMESKVIHAVCAARGVQCVTLRAISDLATEELPLDFNALLTSDQNLSGRKLAAALLNAPHKIPALMRLGWNSARAARALSQVLVSVLEREPSATKAS
jgi:adenosylhomocysteine nucleosidase